MATAGALCTTIIGDLGRADTSISDIVLIDIQSSIREYETQRFYFNEQKLSVTISATDTYALSLFAAAGSGVADIVEVDFIEIVVNSTRTYQPEEKPFQDFNFISGGSSTTGGYPDYYSIYNQALKLYPMGPTTGVTCNMFAHVKFTEIAANGFSSSNVWTNDGSELIRNATLKRLWGRRFRDYEAAQACAIAEQRALVNLQRRTEGLSNQRITGYL